VRTREYDLHDEDDRFALSIDVLIGQRTARSYARRSLRNRIARAGRGLPSCGRLPFGRSFVWDRDRQGGKWEVDPEKRAVIEDVAARYLRGESLLKLAEEHGVNHSQLCLTLRERCGTEWVQEFNSDKLNVHEKVTTTVPRLLDDATIKALRARLTDNRTRFRNGGVKVNTYLLSGYVFCGSCGTALCGATDRHGVRHYYHTYAKWQSHCTVRPRPWVKSDDLEHEVVSGLFNTFGNVAAIERAVKSAIPDCEGLLKRRKRLEGELARLARERERLVDAVAEGLLGKDDIRRKMADYEARGEALRTELEKVSEELGEYGAGEAEGGYYVNCVDGVVSLFSGHYAYCEETGESYDECPGGNDVLSWLRMTPADKRHLVQSVFAGRVRGRPSGVYIHREGPHKPYARGKRWAFKLRGRLPFELVMPHGSQRRSTC
jgi:hypothetical protein